MLSLTDWLWVLLAMGLAGILCILVDKFLNRPKKHALNSEQTIQEQARSGTRAQMRPRTLSQSMPRDVHREEGDVVFPQTHHLSGLDEGHDQEVVVVTRHPAGHQDPFHHEDANAHTFASSYTNDPASKPFLGFHKSEAQLVARSSSSVAQPEKSRWLRRSSPDVKKSNGQSGIETLGKNKGATSASLAKERLQGLGLGRHQPRTQQKTFNVAETVS